VNKHPKDYQNIIFDLGGVLLNLDFNRTKVEFRKSLPHLADESFLGHVNQLSLFSIYEVGKISTDDFYSEFKNHFQTDITFDQFKTCWNAMILDFPKMRVNFLKQLRQNGKKLFLISNINELHELSVEDQFNKLGENVSFSSLFDNFYYSHRVGIRKPNAEIFDMAILQNNLKTSETLFIDDSLQHIEAARKLGLDAFHLKDSNQLEKSDFYKLFRSDG
jgi:epoxide hydrolase-like predicted phosphatase